MNRKIKKILISIFIFSFLTSLKQNVQAVGFLHQAWVENGSILFRTYTTPYDSTKAAWPDLEKLGGWAYYSYNKSFFNKPATYYSFATVGLKFHKYGTNECYYGYTGTIDFKYVYNKKTSSDLSTISLSTSGMQIKEAASANITYTGGSKKTKDDIYDITANTMYRMQLYNNNTIYITDRIITKGQQDDIKKKGLVDSNGRVKVSNILQLKNDAMASTSNYTNYDNARDFVKAISNRKFSNSSHGMTSNAYGSVLNLFDNTLQFPNDAKRTVLVRHVNIGDNSVINEDTIAFGIKSEYTEVTGDKVYSRNDYGQYLGYHVATSTSVFTAKNNATNSTSLKSGSYTIPTAKPTNDEYIVVEMYYKDATTIIEQPEEPEIVPQSREITINHVQYDTDDIKKRIISTNYLTVTQGTNETIISSLNRTGYVGYTLNDDPPQKCNAVTSNKNNYSITYDSRVTIVNFLYKDEAREEFIKEPDRNKKGQFNVSNSVDSLSNINCKEIKSMPTNSKLKLNLTEYDNEKNEIGLPKYYIRAINVNYENKKGTDTIPIKWEVNIFKNNSQINKFTADFGAKCILNYNIKKPSSIDIKYYNKLDSSISTKSGLFESINKEITTQNTITLNRDNQLQSDPYIAVKTYPTNLKCALGNYDLGSISWTGIYNTAISLIVNPNVSNNNSNATILIGDRYESLSYSEELNGVLDYYIWDLMDDVVYDKGDSYTLENLLDNETIFPWFKERIETYLPKEKYGKLTLKYIVTGTNTRFSKDSLSDKTNPANERSNEQGDIVRFNIIYKYEEFANTLSFYDAIYGDNYCFGTFLKLVFKNTLNEEIIKNYSTYDIWSSQTLNTYYCFLENNNKHVQVAESKLKNILKDATVEGKIVTETTIDGTSIKDAGKKIIAISPKKVVQNSIDFENGDEKPINITLESNPMTITDYGKSLYYDGYYAKNNDIYNINEEVETSKKSVNDIITYALDGEKTIEAKWTYSADGNITDNLYYSDRSSSSIKYLFFSTQDSINNESSKKINIFTPISVSIGDIIGINNESNFTPLQLTEKDDNSVISLQKGFQFSINTNNYNGIYGKGFNIDNYKKTYYFKFDFDIRDMKVVDSKNVAVNNVTINNKVYDGNKIITAGTWIKVISTGTITVQASATEQHYEDVHITARATTINMADPLEKDSLLVNKDEISDAYKNICNDIDVTDSDNKNNYLAETEKKIEIKDIDSLYDFKVTDVKDINWKNVFRDSNNKHKGVAYYVGTKKLDPDKGIVTRSVKELGTNPTKTLPIGPYKNTNASYVKAPKLGYRFSFSINRTGAYGDYDIKIKPSFYYISKNGATYNNDIQLYYKNSSGKYVKFDGNYPLTFIPKDNYRYVELNEENHLSSSAQKLLDKNGNIILKATTMSTDSGNFQTYYGEYKLPNSTIAIKKNTNGNFDITDKTTWLKDGYIGIRFNILSNSSDGEISYDVEQEVETSNSSQWEQESYLGVKYKSDTGSVKIRLEKGTWNAQYSNAKGTVILYDIDAAADTDYN